MNEAQGVLSNIPANHCGVCLSQLGRNQEKVVSVKALPIRSNENCSVPEEKSPGANDDQLLVSRALKGELQAFRVLVERYERRVYALALSMLGHVEDAKDLTQEAFLKAFRSLSSFRQQSSFYTWIYRIAVNLAIDERRRRYRHMETSLEHNESFERNVEAQSSNLMRQQVKTPDVLLEQARLGGRIRRAMAQLSAEHRTAIMLREVDGLSYAEISRIVGCSPGTVMSRLHHARKRLRKALLSEEETFAQIARFSVR